MQNRRQGKCGSARSGPGPSLTSLPENLIQLAFLWSFPFYVKVLSPRLAETCAPWSSSILLLLRQIERKSYSRTTNIIVIIISFRKGWNDRFAASAGAMSGASGVGAAGGPGLRPFLLKGKSPQRASGPGGQFCGGWGSSGPPGGLFSVACGDAPLCSAHRGGNIFLKFSQNTQQV